MTRIAAILLFLTPAAAQAHTADRGLDPTGLAGYLRERGVSELVMVGLATDFCVRFSAVDAAKLGFGVSVLEDACRAIDMAGSLAEARADMVAHGVRLTSSDG